MSEKKLSFVPIKTNKEIENVYNFEVNAFADDHGVTWSEESIKEELEQGWDLYSANLGEEIVAAVFVKRAGDTLFTKNTPIKLIFQGNGFSHQIKDYYEKTAHGLGLNRVVHYCPSENFRMISLNEGHDYKQTGNKLGKDNHIIEWEKIIK